MKTFFTVFFAILAAAAVIFAGLWAKSGVDAWGYAWRSCEGEIAAILSSERALSRASEYATSPRSVDDAMARVHEAQLNLKRIEDDGVRIAELEQRAVTILEHKPFGLPLTALERKELAILREDIQKHPHK
jgi:hypothetical protein